MDRQDVLKRLLYPKCKTAIEFQFDSLMVNPMLSYITVQDIAQLNKIATSLKYSSKPKEKYAMIDKIMSNRGFKKMASGTNRVTYRCLNDYRIVIKIAIDKVGLSDNGNEYRNQHLLKPFVTKCFEVSPCGTVGLFERVVPITSREEFINISDDIFDLINNLIGKYVLEDIGEKFYMNYGLREGFGPVLLDYPYVFELDGRKLICNVPEPLEPKGYCGGEIDYDLGYNDLVCKKCGKRYLATELKSDVKSDKPKIIIEGDDIIMRCVLKRGDEIVSKLNSETPVATNTIKSKRDFVNLKAQISEKQEEKEEVFKPTVKTSDEVQLKARLRVPRPTVNEEVKKKEEAEKVVTETIKVSLTPEPEVVEASDTSNLSVKLSEDSKKEHEEEVISQDKSEDTEKEQNYERRGSYSNRGAKHFKGVVTYNGEIWDKRENKLIGYTISECKRRIELVSKEVKDDEKSYEAAIADTITKKESDAISSSPDSVPLTVTAKPFKGNENYRTTDIVAPIDGYFSNTKVSKEERVEEVEVEIVKEETVVEDKAEIPELIIHERESDEEYETVYSSEEEFDPEYDGTDEESEDETSENKIDLY
jgi:hypothetical protein